MTREEAKNVLLSYRPGADYQQDPATREALRLAEQDVELGRWFAENRARQSAIRTAFRSLRAPSALSEQILSERPRPPVANKWRKPVTLVLASAALVLLTLIGIEWKQHRDVQSELSFASYRGRMVRGALRMYGMDLETNSPVAIRAYLGQQQARADYTLPASLTETPTTGCGVLTWQGHRVSMICFNSGRPLKPGQKTDLFLFVMDQNAAGNSPKDVVPKIALVNRMITASWTEGDLTYMLATEGDEGFLRKYL
jgi:hypothetical protein